jgi:CBS domain-containing protein
LVDLLIEHDIGALPVVDDGGNVIGIVTETDLTSKLAYGDEKRGALSAIAATLTGKHPAWLKKASAMIAREIMSPRVVTASPQEDLRHAARVLMEHGCGHLPVVDDDGSLVGMVARRDILRPFHRSDSAIGQDIQQILDNRVFFEQGHNATFSVHEGTVTLTGTVTYPRDVDMLGELVSAVGGVVHVENGARATTPEPELRNDPWADLLRSPSS